MKKIVFIFFIFVSIINVNAETLYIKTFGKSTSKPIIFLHGGPGYNCANFEGTAAQALSENGFFVVVYDRRGEGRSPDKNAKYTFEETFDDLISIYKKFSIQKATLICHSFGGVIGTLFSEKHPEYVQSLFLVSAPVSLQATFKTIIKSSEEIYKAKKDSSSLKYLQKLKKTDTTTIAYSSYCFVYAMRNNFYSPKQRTEESKIIFAKFKEDSLFKYGSQMSFEAPQGFWKNEHYTTLDLTNNLKDVLSKKIKVFALYGKDDGLYSPVQVDELAKMLPVNDLKYLDNCSHNVFIDQQSEFINAIKTWSK